MARSLVMAGAAAAALALTGGTAGAAEAPVLGPDGYKGLELGQSEQEAVDTGLLVDRQQPQDCIFYRLRPEEGKPNPGGGVFVDPNLGVVMIGGTDLIETPEGVGFGTALDEVRESYPGLQQQPGSDFVYETDVPGHPELQYTFAVDEGELVSDFGIEAPSKGACES